MRHLKGTNLWLFFRKVGDANGTPFLHNGGKNSTIFKSTPQIYNACRYPAVFTCKTTICCVQTQQQFRQAEGKRWERGEHGNHRARGEREAVVVWISAHVTNNLLLRLPSRGLTICMAGRHADSESKQTQHLGAPLRLSPCLSKATHLLPSCGARERDKEREREIFRSYFKHCQVTLFLHYMRASASRTLGGLFGDV